MALITRAAASGRSVTTVAHAVAEWRFQSTASYEDPFAAVEADAIFTATTGGATWKVPLFWAGGADWGLRFAAARPGIYRFRTECSNTDDAGLHGREGELVVNGVDGSNALLRHGAVHVADGGGHFAHADGTPFLWLGDSWWHAMTKRLSWPDGFHELVRDRREKGYNALQFTVGFACDMPPYDPRDANEAGHAWLPDYASINPYYFDYTDLRIAHLVENGIVPCLMGLWGYVIYFMRVEKAKLHYRYLVARYGAFPVVWNLAGEIRLVWYHRYPETEHEHARRQVAMWTEVAAYLKRIDPFRRMLTVHPATDRPVLEGVDPLGNMDLLDCFLIQGGHNEYRALAQSLDQLRYYRSIDPARPAIISEAGWEGMFAGTGPKVQRLLFWGAVLSGMPGHCYGADSLWQMNSRRQPFGPSAFGQTWQDTPWEVAYQWDGARHVAIGKRILENFRWWELEPHPEWIDHPWSPEEPEGVFCAGIPGELRICYVPVALPFISEFHLLGLERDRQWWASLYEPTSGRRFNRGPIEVDTEGRWRIVGSPMSQDWVVVLERMDTTETLEPLDGSSAGSGS